MSLPGHLDRHAAYYQHDQERLSVQIRDRFDLSLWQSMLEVGCLVDVKRKGN
jgi:hypothetical protein